MRRPSIFGLGLLSLVFACGLAGCVATDPGRDAARPDDVDEPANGPDAEVGGSAESSDPRPGSRMPFSPDSPIKVDQFGYRPGDPKWAVLTNPQEGFNKALTYEPGPVLEVRRVEDDEVVFTAEPAPWNDGAVHRQSGDRGWWVDFTDLRQPGAYYPVDLEAGVAGPEFVIADDVYDDVLDVALRAFWYNRANAAHPEDLAGPWHDAAAFVGAGQDTKARSIDDPDNPATTRDLSGGWFDAGDVNKYVTFAGEPVHVLLTAYERAPAVFGDDVGIPESGNGVPDLVDELFWELDWMERMQNDDGGVLIKVGVVDLEGPTTPSTSRLLRFYEEACSSSTITAAGVFAHAAVVLGSMPGQEQRAERLADRAADAWEWYEVNPKRDDCDPQIIWAGDADLSLEDQRRESVVAAVYLFALTGENRFDTVVRQGFGSTAPFDGEGFGHYGLDHADALVAYTKLDGADPTVTAAIKARMSDLLSWSPLFGPGDTDLYRAHLPDTSYHWGSNMVKANAGTANLLVDPDGFGPDRALDHLHYFHGVNPLGLCYLSNTSSIGADRSIQHLLHFWFGDGSPYDVTAGSAVGVPPGYVVGGPNQHYSGSDSPPAGQPAQKSYRDWAAYGAQPSWETTEPAIYYQAAYVRLLAEVLAAR